jgi:antitoxin component of MazEF toxin-antitoxin module
MTIIVRSSKQDEITIPDRLMDQLNLQDGDEVKTIIEGNTLRLTPIVRPTLVKPGAGDFKNRSPRHLT